MPCGPQLIESVIQILKSSDRGWTPAQLRAQINVKPSLRAIRYAIQELIKDGRVARHGEYGPVYAVRAE